MGAAASARERPAARQERGSRGQQEQDEEEQRQQELAEKEQAPRRHKKPPVVAAALSGAMSGALISACVQASKGGDGGPHIIACSVAKGGRGRRLGWPAAADNARPRRAPAAPQPLDVLRTRMQADAALGAPKCARGTARGRSPLLGSSCGPRQRVAAPRSGAPPGPALPAPRRAPARPPQGDGRDAARAAVRGRRARPVARHGADGGAAVAGGGAEFRRAGEAQGTGAAREGSERSSWGLQACVSCLGCLCVRCDAAACWAACASHAQRARSAGQRRARRAAPRPPCKPPYLCPSPRQGLPPSQGQLGYLQAALVGGEGVGSS
jgi:hypothetical protein